MTYGRALPRCREQGLDRATVSHSAELVRGDLLSERVRGPLIRPSCWKRVFDTTGTFSPRGEGLPRRPLQNPCAGVNGVVAALIEKQAFGGSA